ncbi:3-oxoacyl-ACP reductase FabG [Christensenellaceae bacterium OttesenSCG-928-K19]|nr:3-oxoacyl-ACP reductase FabG [Christensenellaceae bacterium OttesenSCG-928-K19]
MATALVTGASRGIGRETALVFAKSGYDVIINYNQSEAQAKELAQEINRGHGAAHAAAIKADVSNEKQVRAMFEQARQLFSPVDVLVNNAAVAWAGLLTDMSADEWDQLFAVNMRGAFLCSKEALPHMVSKKNGCIINISSIWGITGASCEVAYSAAKAALIGFTKALAKEVGPSGVRVNCIAPGVIDTEMNGQLTTQDFEEIKEQTPLGTIGSTHDVAQAVLYLASGRGGFYTGQVLSPNGGLVI